MSSGPEFRVRLRISTLLLLILTGIAGLVLLGLVVVTIRLVQIQEDLASLYQSALPRLVKLSQLSQEAAATISTAPALSANPTRFEFDTLLSRIDDKKTSQQTLIEELGTLIRDPHSANLLRSNGDLLMDNLDTLTGVVNQQIAVRKRLEKEVEHFRGLARGLPPPERSTNASGPEETDASAEATALLHLGSSIALRALTTLLDPNGARFSRNKKNLDENFDRLDRALSRLENAPNSETEEVVTSLNEWIEYWRSRRETILKDKQAELSNDFKIKALVEENARIANRLLSGANTEFWRASAELEAQIGSVDSTARFTLASIIVVIVAFGAGNFLVWLVLKRRVFQRLDQIRSALQAFADTRTRPNADPLVDEIGEISRALIHYMTVIHEREVELADKTGMLEQLSSQLSKYLSPQVYASIFSGEREVTVSSSRKKLTIFFSDIVGFTETADRLESEELSQLLNHYLTEMSRIALNHGATIDKYVGDAILVFFGDPETKGFKADAIACVEMAIAMRQKMRDLQDTWRSTGIEKPLQVRMGIHTGYCTVGNFGSEDRMDYTIIGGAVNTASRLETLAEPGEILISFETYALVNDRICCAEHGETRVKGIAYPVATYRILDSYDNLNRQRRRFREEHPNVKLDLNLEAMSSADREQAANLLRRALEMVSSDTDSPKS